MPTKSHPAPARVRRVVVQWQVRILGLVIPLIVFAAWEAASHRGWVSAVFLPTPERTAESFIAMVRNEGFLRDVLVSLAVVSGSFLTGSLLGVGVGVLAGLSRTVERVLGPTLDAIRHVPPVAWLPLIVLWVGIGPLGKVVFIVKVVFFPVFLNTLQAIRGVQREYIDLGNVLTLSRWQLLRKVIAPAALPGILVGLRYGASLAWALIVVAEGLSGMQGLGFLIFRAQSLLMTDQLLVCMLVIGVIGFGIDLGMRRLERRLIPWQRGYEGG